MNQTNILVVTASVAALLTLSLITTTQWLAPWVPLAVGLGWLVAWGAAWAVFRGMEAVDVPRSLGAAKPAVVAASLVPVVMVLWMVGSVRAVLVPTVMTSSPEAVDAIMEDGARQVHLAVCRSAGQLERRHWSKAADAIAQDPSLVEECASGMPEGLLSAVGDRWATALKRSKLDEGMACTLSEKLAEIRQERPRVLARELMSCVEEAQSEAARGCCEASFDGRVDPVALLEAGDPLPQVLASMVRGAFGPGGLQDDVLGEKLLRTTCSSGGNAEVAQAYLPFVEAQCGGVESWQRGYGVELWERACAEPIAYQQDRMKRGAAGALCRGLETGAVARAIEEARVPVGASAVAGRSEEGVSPGLLAKVARTARARGGGTSGAGIEKRKESPLLTQTWLLGRDKELVLRSDKFELAARCRRAMDMQPEEFGGLVDEHLSDDAEYLDLVEFNPCSEDIEVARQLGEDMSKSGVDRRALEKALSEGGTFGEVQRALKNAR